MKTMRNIICPKCKSNNIIPILFGYPSPEDMEAAEQGLIKLGGCIVMIDGCEDPDCYCKDCGYEWSVDHLLASDVVKVRFRYWSNWRYYDPESTTEDQLAYEIYPDGTVKYTSHPMAGRKVLNKITAKVESEKVTTFYGEGVEFIQLPAVICGSASGHVALGIVIIDLQFSGEHWGTFFLTPHGVLDQGSKNLDADKKEYIRKEFIPYDYWYTPKVYGDIHVDFNNIPNEVQELMQLSEEMMEQTEDEIGMNL